MLELVTVNEGKEIIQGEEFEFLPLPHGHEDTLGILHGKMAYLIDCREIPPASLQKLSDARLDLLIIDCLRSKPHETHLHLDLALRYIAEIRPKNAVLTHMSHEWDYLDLTREIRRRGVKNTFPARDGLCFLYS